MIAKGPARREASDEILRRTEQMLGAKLRFNLRQFCFSEPNYVRGSDAVLPSRRSAPRSIRSHTIARNGAIAPPFGSTPSCSRDYA
jgi:hypothetical protein